MDPPDNTLVKLLEKFPDKPWYFDQLSRNSSITFETVLANPDKPWDWLGLSWNPSITFNNVLAHPDKPWDWYFLSRNSSITFENVLEHPDKPWNWKLLSQNPSITFENVLEHPDKPWDWDWLSYNNFNYKKRYTEYKAARTIQAGCWNWLHQVTCKDGSLGINYRLSVETLVSQGLVNW